MAADTLNQLPKLKEYVKLNLGRALLPDTHTMLFMRFIANDGQDNLLWSLSFNTEAAKLKFGDLPQPQPHAQPQLEQQQTTPEALVQELVRRMQATDCSPGIYRLLRIIFDQLVIVVSYYNPLLQSCR